MTTEILKNAEVDNLKSQMDLLLAGFNAELAPLKAAAGEQEKELTAEEMTNQLEATKMKIKEYVKINGMILNLKDLVVDEKNLMYKMTYTIILGGKSYDLPSYFKVINTLNNSYIKFQIPPGKTESAPDVFLDGKVYDINVIKEKRKDIDIRIQYNEQKTLAKILDKINAFDLKKDKSFEIKRDEGLENTQITGLNDIALGKEVTKTGSGLYYRAVFLKENGKYRELGKVFFNANGDVDTGKTVNTKFKVLNVELGLNFDLSSNSFTLDKYDDLVVKVLKHRMALKDFVANSSVADNTIFEGFNRIGSTWTKTTNIGLTLIDDTYTVQWGKNKEDVLRFGFDANDKLSLKDLKSASVDSFLLPVVVNGKTRLYDIKKLDSKLQITESQEKEFQTIHELPELEDAPATLKAKNLYAYSDQARELEYFTADGKLVAGIPSSKTEATNEWKLETLTQDVDPYDLFKEYKTTLPSSLASLNILENDLYKIFADAFTKSFADKNDATKSLLTGRPVVKVLEGETYKYYKVEQGKVGQPFVFEKDEELYDEAKRIIDLIKMNLQVLETLAKTQLKYKDGKQTKDFLKFQGGTGGIGLLDVSTADKLAFLQTGWKDEKSLARILIYSNGLLNGGGDVKTLNFFIKKDNIILEGKKKNEVIIEGQKFQISSENKGGQLSLWFDTI